MSRLLRLGQGMAAFSHTPRSGKMQIITVVFIVVLVSVLHVVNGDGFWITSGCRPLTVPNQHQTSAATLISW